MKDQNYKMPFINDCPIAFCCIQRYTVRHSFHPKILQPKISRRKMHPAILALKVIQE